MYTSVTIEGVSHEMWLPVLDSANKAMKAVPYTYTTPKWDYNPQTRRREKIGMEERTVEAASMFDVNKAIMRCLVKNLAMFGLGLYVYSAYGSCISYRRADRLWRCCCCDAYGIV